MTKDEDIQELLEQNAMVVRNHLLCEQDLNECREILTSVVCQACYIEEKKPLDSMAISAYAEGLRYLERIGKVKILSQHGRRVIAEEVES